MASTETSKKRLALAIIDYLNTSVTDGTVSSEEAESIEIATNCIGEAFKVDPSDQAAVKDAVGGQSLLSIYSVYEKLKGKSTASTKGTSSASEARPATPQTAGSTEQKAAGDTGLDAKTKEEAEKLKAEGNKAMQQKDYNKAIDFYTQALDLNPLHPIYLSNRAAAYSGAQRHEDAKSDAEMAVAADPNFAKAWSRMGLAKFALGDAKGSMEAYQKGIDAEGNGGSEAMRKGYETAKRKVEEEGDDDSEEDMDSAMKGPPGGGMGGGGGMPDLSSLAGMFGGGGAGGGGMPDFGAMMNNPMMKQMAQNLMSNPEAMSGLLNNPQLRGMAEQFGAGGGGGGGAGRGAGGGGMPDLAGLMADPNLREMASKFMGGGAGGASGAGRGAGGA